MSFGMMEALLSFLRRQVGLRSDPADPAGSLHAKVGNNAVLLGAIQAGLAGGVLLREVVASDTLRLSADASGFNCGTTYVKMREIMVLVGGFIRVSFDLRRNQTTAYGRIYKNGEPVGVERSNTSDTFITYTEDFHCAPGDTFELWIKNSGSSNCTSIRNFRIFFDFLTTPVGGVVTKDS